ncbi:RHS repeat-associated core domain-containing protein [Empedobacter brevis]|uniref:RHS repeat-associated core domain-containing protein n=1 Tax=Empedobacter brevis TaxID=247 RepID=UPI002FDF5E98
MKKYIYFLYFLIPFIFLKAQENEIVVKKIVTNTSGYLDANSRTIDKPGDVSLSENVIPTIKGELNVNAQGSLSYSIPVEVFKGVNEFQPNLSLSYNSQVKGGFAGYGWNITGLSSITIGGKNKRIDGIYQGIQYNGNDPFYLDGQRLIKVDETNYITESLSKIKIKRNGDIFTVHFTDGKVSTYVLKTLGQYLITQTEDAFGNLIKYSYFTSNNTAYIEAIEYGGTNFPFKISFGRKMLNFPNKIYRNGTGIIDNYVLNEIIVSSTSDGVFRKYALIHDTTSLNDFRLRKVSVSNKNGEELKPLLFNYNSQGGIEVVKQTVGAKKINSEAKSLGSIIYGDFEGNGKVTAAFTTRPEIKIKNNAVVPYTLKTIHSKLGELSSSLDLGFREQLFTGRIIDKNNQLSYNDRVISLHQIANESSYVAYSNGFVFNEKQKITATDIITNSKLDVKFNLSFGYSYSDERCGPNDDTSCVRIQENNNVRRYEGDFNNDGLIDILLFTDGGYISKHQSSPTGEHLKSSYSDFLYDVEIPSRIYFIEIGKNIKNGGTITPTIIAENYTIDPDNLYTMEFDGDGIPELLTVNTQNNTFTIYKFLNNSLTAVLSNVALNNFTKDTPLLLGDFNGDGLTDFMTPLKIYDVEKDGIEGVAKGFANDQKEWWQYINTGKNFVKTKRNFTAQNLSYCKPSQRNIIDKSSGWEKFWSGKMDQYSHSEYTYCGIIPIDYNHDGKTDFISFNKFAKIKPYSSSNSLLSASIENIIPNNGGNKTNKIFFVENIADNSANTFSLNLNSSNIIDIKDDKISPYTLILNNSDVNTVEVYNSGFQFYDAFFGTETSFLIKTNSFIEGQLKEIDNNSGVKQFIEYTPLAENIINKKNLTNKNLYYTPEKELANNLKYPYYLNKQQPNYYLVKRVTTAFDEKAVSKEYRYANAIQHLDGLGFIGFQKTFSSDPYESKFYNNENEFLPIQMGTDVLWTVNTYDPLLENQQIKSTYGNLIESNYLTRSDFQYERVDHPNKQYSYIKKSSVAQDVLKNIPIYTNYSYNSEKTLITSIETFYDDEGKSLSKYTYTPEFWNGNHYFFGKISSKEEILSKDLDSFSTKERYTYYTDGSTKISIKNGNNTASLITTLDYFSNGNKKSETITGEGITVPLKTSFEYDSTNRFISKTTSPEGLVDIINSNIYGQVLSTKNYLGLESSYEYDSWGNNTKKIDEYGIVTILNKESLTNGNYSLYTSTQGQPKTISVFDKFDRVIQSKTQTINNQWIIKDIVYDIFGKKIKESEPYFNTESASKWNEIEYDGLDRPVKQKLYTGQIITTCYEGNSVTVDDGYNKTFKASDAMGNVIRHQDKGGVIMYEYYPNGNLKKSKYDNITITIEQDGWGNKTKLTDPSAGIYTYKYDILGKVLEEVSPKGKTVYSYDDYGKLLTETITSDDNSIISSTYEYNPVTKFLSKLISVSNGQNYTYETKYDNQFRVNGKIETHPNFTYESKIEFDVYNRSKYVTLNTRINEINKTTSTKLEKVYDANGILIEEKDALNNRSIKKINQLNSKGQPTEFTYGNGFKLTNSYNDIFLPSAIKAYNSSTKQTAVDIEYNFDRERKILHSRNIKVFNANESFEYDALDRLTKEKINGVLDKQYVYDEKGRMVYNSEIGKYNYSANNYKLNAINYNQKGINNLADRGGNIHQIKFNSYKQATEIYLKGKDRISFDFNPFKSRSVAYFGSENTDKNARPYRKYYSSDNAVEIIKKDGVIKVVTYIDGDPYSSSYIKVDQFNSASGANTPNNYYLHRDYQGSIVALSNTSGRVVEKRYFDAWGNIKQVVHTSWNGTVATNTTNKTLGILDRGYTGHEHLQSVGLIHMNGRLYDPLIRRFLSPDNFVQDPYNTQNFDRYTYVYNNPLMYNDPSGEWIQIVIGAAIAIASNMIMNAIQGIPIWYGIGKAATIGAVSGAVSFGIGTAATQITAGVAKASFQVVAHGLSGAIMSEIDGGNGISGMLSGMISSAISSAVQGLTSTTFYADEDYTQLATVTKDKALSDVLTVAAGTLSGGISASVSGGNFWQGIRQGAITSGLNHIANHVKNSFKNYELGLLSDIEGASDMGHGALYVGNDKVGYSYYSKDGAQSGGAFGESKSRIIQSSSKSDLLNIEGENGTTRYDRSLVFKITHKEYMQIRTDANKFIRTYYNLFTNNCANIWDVALNVLNKRPDGNYSFKGGLLGPNSKFQQLKTFYFPEVRYESRYFNKW